MFKKLMAAGFISASVIAAPASAATFLQIDNSSPESCTTAEAVCNFMISGEVDQNGSFTITSNVFTLPGSGIFAGRANNTSTSNTDIEFSSVILTNTVSGATFNGTVANGRFSVAQFDTNSLGSGSFTLTLGGTAQVFAGSSTSPASFPSIGGTASFEAVAVPEPATWALFILGFGAIGATLRRRSSAIRVSKASLHFA